MIGVCRWGRGVGRRRRRLFGLFFFSLSFLFFFFFFLSFFCVNNRALRERKTARGAAGQFSSS